MTQKTLELVICFQFNQRTIFFVQKTFQLIIEQRIPLKSIKFEPWLNNNEVTYYVVDDV